MRRWITAGLTSSVLLGFFFIFAPVSRSGGVPVIDVENLVQNVLNYAQNVISATNSSTQVANQVTQIAYQARNVLPLNVSLADPGFSELQQLNSTLSSSAGLGHSLQSVSQRYNNLYGSGTSGMSPQQLRDMASQQDVALREENLNSIAAQSGIVGSANAGASELQTIMAKSRAAQGNLEATQATNELVGQLVKQQLKTQEMVALHSRVISSDIAQRQAEKDAAALKHQRNIEAWGKKSSATPLSEFP